MSDRTGRDDVGCQESPDKDRGATQTVLSSVPAGINPRDLEALFTSLLFLLLASHPMPNDVIVINNHSEHPGRHKFILAICA